MTAEATIAVAPGAVGPVREKDRIHNLDMLRGFAILGILAVNAMAFAWPVELMMAEAPPPGELTRADMIGLWVTDVFFSDKMRTLFTMLFGVSVFLVGGERSDEVRGKVLIRRLLWLGLFGALHGALLWYGDILLHYAYCGLLMMLMRSWTARRLLWVGGLVTLLWGVVATLGMWGMANMPAEFAEQMEAGRPSATPESIAAAVEIYRSGWPAGLVENLKAWGVFQLMASPFLIPITVPLMMVGLGLFKSGYLAGRAPMWTYLLVLLAGGANLAVFALWAWQKTMAGEGADPTGGLAAAAGGMAPLITLFYATLLILMVRFGLKPLTRMFVPVGRMAFTNYLTQTLIMVTLYYAPWGLMWFGTHSPVEMWQVVGAVWVAQLIWSPLWLSVFQMGPLEWVWRCLTYGRMVPIRRAA
ncbi:MAG: DUF418 domain-containing protein [Brevundimonas sp.]|uniref:DUF418 domain-containing protein n=1 Tax=Brevundimonas sp. TaxID=1871086 RepID=UPI00261A9238|nr:DUF418 domain-containing protein [Brevundimonas sp.]MDI6624469.1 DUF418 domain-containing protein [Brevundimonas sp.]MDQ7811926.1 DUF418 domain-containing protein [Brevundimonas sp.]